MRIAALILITLTARSASAQEFGAYGVKGHAWDMGNRVYGGYGFSFALLGAPTTTGTRGGMRFTFDAFPTRDDGSGPPAPCPAFRTTEAAQSHFGCNGPLPHERRHLKQATLSWVLLPYLSPTARAEVSVGGAWEDGMSSDGESVVLGLGFSRRLGKAPVLLNLGLQQRFNNKRREPEFGAGPAQRLTRRSVRVGLLLDLTPPTEASNR